MLVVALVSMPNGFLVKTGRGIAALKYVVKIEEFMAVAIVIYVLARYMVFLFDKETVQVKAKN